MTLLACDLAERWSKRPVGEPVSSAVGQPWFLLQNKKSSKRWVADALVVGLA
jgi:hypothetical protein